MNNFRHYVELAHRLLKPKFQYTTKGLISLGFTKPSIKKLARRGWLKQKGSHNTDCRFYMHLEKNEG